MDASSRPWPPATTANRFETTFSYIIPFGKLNETSANRIYSPWHVVAGFKWRLLIFPRGNNFYEEDDFQHVSIYLDCGGPHTDDTPPDPDDDSEWESFWRRPASFDLTLLCPSSTSTAVERSPGIQALASSDADTIALDSDDEDDGTINDIVKHASHVFCKGASDWGFSMFALTDRMCPGKYAEPNGDVTVMVKISFQNTVRRTRFKNCDWDSRKQTGFVGIKNQGITDYLNVLLQMMYTVREIRNAVHHTPREKASADSDDDSVNRKAQIGHALQSIFTQLKESPTAVATNQLTDAFQWTKRDCFYCRTVKEFQETLIDWYADRVNSTDKPDPLTRLLEGKESVHYERGEEKNGHVERTFYALSLNVEDGIDLCKCFETYTDMRILEDSETEESQDRKEYIRFAKLPQILLIELKRLYRDGHSAYTSEHISFPKELNLSRFVEDSDGTDVYELHSVVVHDGDLKGGYYSVFIRPQMDTVGEGTGDKDKWFEFDDEMVRPCSEKEAIEQNFGGGAGVQSCAWALQYLRKSG